MSYCQSVFGAKQSIFAHCSHFSFIMNKQSTFPFHVSDLIDSVHKRTHSFSFAENVSHQKSNTKNEQQFCDMKILD